MDYLASGVVRRALAVYMQHLADLADPAAEVRAAYAACAVSPTSPEAQEAAWKRLETHQSGQPLPPFVDVLRGTRWAAELAAVVDQADALADSLTVGAAH